MMISPYAERWDRREKVLLSAPDPAAFAELGAELARRGAEVVSASDIEGAAEMVRAGGLDAVYLAARDSCDATKLLMRLIAGHSRGARVMLVVEAAAASLHADLLTLAEETMTFALSATRMADAAGIGFHRAAVVD